MNAGTSPWDEACAPWIAARREELAYDADVWGPQWEAHGADLPEAVDDVMDRLVDRRLALEEVVMKAPAVNARQLATKFLIAFDGGREAYRHLADILIDCRRLGDDSLTRGKLSPDESLADAAPVGRLRGFLIERNAHLQAANEHGEGTPAQISALDQCQAAEDIILSTPAATDDDVIARLILIAQTATEGFEPPEDFCATVVREAQAHFGMGALFLPAPPANTEATNV